MKKGVTTQIFIFIFALLMIVLVLVFGIKSLGTVKKTADKVELLTFVDRLDDAIQTYYSFDVGSNEVIDLLLPGQIEEVCFSNPGEGITNSFVDEGLLFFVENNKQDNLYVLPLETFTSPAPDFKIDHLRIKETKNPLCITTQGKLQIHIETVLHENQIFVQIQEV